MAKYTSKSRKIFVTSSGADKISVFEADASGDISPIRAIESSTVLFRPQALFVDTENNEVFVANLNDTITVYENTSEGDVYPIRTIRGDNTGLSFPKAIFVDVKNSEIFVVNPYLNTVTVYERTAKGNVRPLRTLNISGSKSNDSQESRASTGVFIDMEYDELFVVDSALIIVQSPVQSTSIPGFTLKSSIKIFKRTAEGDSPPLRTIEGENTGLLNPSGIFADNYEIFVVNPGNNTVTVYDKKANGNTPALRTLSILDSNHAGFRKDEEMASGIFLDKKNNEMFISSLSNTITVYEKTAEGKASPLRILGPNTGLLDPNWIHVDSVNNEIFVNNSFSQLITVYSITDNGNAAPLKTMPQGLLSSQVAFVDKYDYEIFITNLNDSITIYPRSGDSSSIRTIQGSNTELSSPEGIFVDTDNNEIFVANSGNNTVTLYDITAKENQPPLRTIGGSNTGLLYPFGIFVAESP